MASLIPRELPNTHRGSSLNDFFIEKKIGDGAYSQVFKVVRKSDNREYALKQVSAIIICRWKWASFPRRRKTMH